ncbi:hypothetical protein U1Q18_040246 [Sarracenia purpurea var. burkii]
MIKASHARKEVEARVTKAQKEHNAALASVIKEPSQTRAKLTKALVDLALLREGQEASVHEVLTMEDDEVTDDEAVQGGNNQEGRASSSSSVMKRTSLSVQYLLYLTHVGFPKRVI